MRTNERELLAKLSDDEQTSLQALCSCSCNREIPGDHAEKLLDLGLAELTCGGLCPTRAGKHALAARTAH